MVGVVVVSHSKKLADEIIKLCNEMKKYDFPVVNGSGLLDDDTLLGSDPMKIKEAIESVYTEDGVLIFADIGSSVLNSEMAIEFLDEKYNKEKVIIADAPIVEGTLITMSINDGITPLEEILKELEELKKFKKVN